MGSYCTKTQVVANPTNLPASGELKDLTPPTPTKSEPGGLSWSQFIPESRRHILDFYKFDKRKVGVGAYGSVCKVKNTSSGKVRACKTMSKAQMKTVERCKQEIAILQLMDHPNIVKLFETYEDSRCVYLIMELCVGGELFESIISSDHFGEKDAAVLMKQIIRGLYYMHQLHVCHRDLKPENFLFLQKGHVKDTTLKIIDFGLSCFFEEGQYLVTRAGTPYYCPASLDWSIHSS